MLSTLLENLGFVGHDGFESNSLSSDHHHVESDIHHSCQHRFYHRSFDTHPSHYGPPNLHTTSFVNDRLEEENVAALISGLPGPVVAQKAMVAKLVAPQEPGAEPERVDPKEPANVPVNPAAALDMAGGLKEIKLLKKIAGSWSDNACTMQGKMMADPMFRAAIYRGGHHALDLAYGKKNVCGHPQELGTLMLQQSGSHMSIPNICKKAAIAMYGVDEVEPSDKHSYSTKRAEERAAYLEETRKRNEIPLYDQGPVIGKLQAHGKRFIYDVTSSTGLNLPIPTLGSNGLPIPNPALGPDGLPIPNPALGPDGLPTSVPLTNAVDPKQPKDPAIYLGTRGTRKGDNDDIIYTANGLGIGMVRSCPKNSKSCDPTQVLAFKKFELIPTSDDGKVGLGMPPSGLAQLTESVKQQQAKIEEKGMAWKVNPDGSPVVTEGKLVEIPKVPEAVEIEGEPTAPKPAFDGKPAAGEEPVPTVEPSELPKADGSVGVEKTVSGEVDEKKMQNPYLTPPLVPQEMKDTLEQDFEELDPSRRLFVLNNIAEAHKILAAAQGQFRSFGVGGKNLQRYAKAISKIAPFLNDEMPEDTVVKAGL